MIRTGRWTYVAVGVAGAVIGAGAVGLLPRIGADPDRGRIERVVHDYVLANPEIIPQAMQKLQDRETGKAVAAQGAAIRTPFADAWAGNPKGDVTIVEYFDYNCGYCRASLPTIASLLAADPNVRIVYRDLPILSAQSRVAARASLAAAAQGKFVAFHDALYAAGPVSEATIAAAMRTAGVDPARIAPLDRTIDAEIGRNMQSAAKLGVTGTPSWVIGDRLMSGAQPIEELQKAIAAARAE